MRARLGRELILVIAVAFAILAPGISTYSLVDPWETHYGEVARNMVADGDLVQTKWPGISYDGGANEGFRSKPVLSFWMMAASMRALGVASDGGYSGELTRSTTVMIAVRIPFVLCAIAGLALMWWMLARLLSRRIAWLGLLVVGSAPMFCLVARQAIPDMPMVACTIGAVSLFILAVEDGDRPVTRFRRWDARHVVVGAAGAFVLVQAGYYAVFFALNPRVAVPTPMPPPALWLPLAMIVLFAGLSREGWLIVRLPFLLPGLVAWLVRGRPPIAGGFFDLLAAWERDAIDRYLLRALPLTLLVGLVAARFATRLDPMLIVAVAALIVATGVVWALQIAAAGWAGTHELADRLLTMSPITTMRQVYLIGCYFLLGVGLLAKGPPGFAVVAAFGALYAIAFHRWRALWEGAFELKRGILLIVVVALPWHVGMYLKEGSRFVSEYLYQHILNRAGDGSVDKSLGTFEHYTAQLGYGMWLWAALLPAALAAAIARSSRATREGRVRLLIGMWAVAAITLFCLIQTKFHHYILPAIPPLGLLVAVFLDDVLARRDRLHPLLALLGAAILLLLCRDLMFEPERWVEMFVYRYDRPWPIAEPYAIDVSDGFLALGIAGALALVIASTRFARAGAVLILATGLAICIWGLQIYMPIAGKHWGMREAMASYYDQRTLYGQKLVYFGDAQLADDWSHVGNTWSFDTVIPTSFQLGQPMTITVQLNRAEDERIMEQELALVGTATALGDHTIEVTFAPGERAKLNPLVARGKTSGKRGRPPVRAVDADRLIAYLMYWRGEQFWSAGEVWAWLPEMKTCFPTANAEFGKYINDRNRAPLGRRYFIITQSVNTSSLRGLLPTPRAKDTLEILDTTSNKFTLASFTL